MEKYVDNYCIYHKLEGRGKISESEKKKQFMSSLTEEVNALGFSIRTEKQIDQKIRDELKIVRKYAAALRRADASGGVASLPRLNRVQRFVYEALEHEPKVIGSYGEEPRRSSDLWRRKRRVFEEEAPYLEPQPTQQHSPRFVSKVKGEEVSRHTISDSYESDGEGLSFKETADETRMSDGCTTMPKITVVYNHFTEEETALIMEKYVDNHDTYHKRLTGGDKFGESEKKKFLSSLTEEVNAMGYSVRTEKQIDQKIRDELKTVKKYAAALRQGSVALPRLSRVQKFVYDAMENEPRIVGYHRVEAGSSTETWPQKRKLQEDDVPYLEPQVALERPSKAIRREKSEEAKIQLNLNQQKLVDTELRNAQLRRENLLMEKQILELKLLYWKEKNRL